MEEKRVAIPSLGDVPYTDEILTGTTLIACEYDGGVVVGTDSRTSGGSFIAGRVTDKITPVTEHMSILRSGSAADTQAIIDIAKYYAETYTLPLRQIRAKFDDETINVYQAYNEAIANAAIQATTFVSPFKMDRMTWIKPSFLWMAYRSGWATKPGQERILAIKIKRSGFEWALTNASLSNHEAKEEIKKSPVRIQWDPERDISMNKLTVRSIQIGLSGVAVEKYVNEWIVGIEDVTIRMKEIGRLIESGELEQAKRMLPKEEVYPLNEEISKIISADG